MEICILGKKKMISGMEKANICMAMGATIMVIGSKVKWKDRANCMIQMEIFNMRDNGKMTNIMAKVQYMALEMSNGSSMSENSRQEEWRDLDRCILKMEINIKDNLEMIIHGVRVECL